MTTPADVDIQTAHLNTVALDALNDAEKAETLSYEDRRKLEKQWREIVHKIKRWTRELEKLETQSLD